jgi:hypothetical protein
VGNMYPGVYTNASQLGPCAMYFCTLINNKIAGFNLVAGAQNWVAKNCLIYQDSAIITTATHVPQRYSDAAFATGIAFDYNLYYFDANPPASIAGATKTLAQWKALSGSQDAHSLSADPLLAVEYSDLRLQAGSPCKLAGTPIAGITTDYAGNARDATRPTIGAYE